MGFKHIARMTRYLQKEGWDDKKIIDLIQYIGEEKSDSANRDGSDYDFDNEDEDLDTTYVISADELISRQTSEEESVLEAEDLEAADTRDEDEMAGRWDGADETLRINNETADDTDVQNAPHKTGNTPALTSDNSENDRKQDEETAPPQKKEAGTDIRVPNGAAAYMDNMGLPPVNTKIESTLDKKHSEEAASKGIDAENKTDDKPGENERKTVDPAKDGGADPAGTGPDKDNAEHKPDASHNAANKASAAKEPHLSENDNGSKGKKAEKDVLSKAKYVLMREIKKSDLTYSILNIKITNFDGNVTRTSIISTPLDSAVDDSRILALRRDRKVSSVIVSENGPSAELDIFGYPVKLTAYMENGTYHTRCSLPQEYENDGTKIEYGERLQTGKGHIVIRRNDIYFHIVPVAFTNNEAHDNLTALFVCAEYPDGTMRFGSSEEDMRVRLNINDKDLEITASWEDDRLRPQIKAV